MLCLPWLPLQSHAAFQELILDMQEAVLAEGLHLVYNLAAEELPSPVAPSNPDRFLPDALLTAGSVLRVSGGWGMCAIVRRGLGGRLVPRLGFWGCWPAPANEPAVTAAVAACRRA